MEDACDEEFFFLFLNLSAGGPQEINSREIRLHLTFSANWNKRDIVWKNTNSF